MCNDFAFPQSSAQGPGFFPRASAQSSDTFPKASDTLCSPAADAFSPPLDTFRTPLGAPPHKRQNQGSGRPGGQQVPLTPTPPPPPPLAFTPAAITPFTAFNGDFTKEELGEHTAARASTAAPSPLASVPSGGAAVLRKLLADQQRRLAALVPELEEGQSREEELVAKLQAVEQDSQVSPSWLLVQVFLSSSLKGVDLGVIP